MGLWQIVVLAVVQGLTEFLPISSSAHLILASEVVGWRDQGLAFDVACHVGTLLAVMLYFRDELHALARETMAALGGGSGERGTVRLAGWVALATLPAAICGWLFAETVATSLRSPAVIAATTIGFGLALWVTDAWARGRGSEHAVGWRRAMAIGVAQALALIPGTSRSGVTITAGLALGLTRTAATRFSFLLSIPIIALAGGYGALSVALQQAPIDWGVFLLAALLSGITAYLCIDLFLAWVERMGMLPFVIYRLVLGAVLIPIAL